MKSGWTQEQHAGQRRRQPATAPTPLMRPCAEMTRICRLHLEALAHHRREVVEHLGQVAARLALRQHRGDEEPRVEHRHAPRHRPQRVGQRHAEVLLVVDAPELAPTGAGISSAAMPSPVVNAWPARSARAMRSIASGNCSSNVLQALRALAAARRCTAASASEQRRGSAPTRSMPRQHHAEHRRRRPRRPACSSRNAPTVIFRPDFDDQPLERRRSVRCRLLQQRFEQRHRAAAAPAALRWPMLAVLTVEASAGGR